MLKKSPEKKPKQKDKKNEETTLGLSCIEVSSEVYEAEDCSLAILPTFSCKLEGRENIRCMRDSGCQSNFILEDRAKGENLSVVKSDVVIKINGFNSSQIYNTNCYNVALNIGTEIFNIEAIGIPKIPTSLKLPGLSAVARGFAEKGYSLADKFLKDGSDEINNVEFILGSNSAYCLKEVTVAFGEVENNVPSVYSQTSAGVMLVGNVEQMLSNLRFLPSLSSRIEVQCSDAVEASCQEKVITCEDLGLHRNICIEPPSELDMPETEVGFAIFDENGEIIDSQLQNATKHILDKLCYDTLNYDKEKFVDDSDETNEKLINFVLRNTTRNDDGRLVMPLIWNHKVDHLLGKNRNLATQILKSNFKKLSKNSNEYLKMVDQTFREQTEMGIIERIDNLDQFLEENPSHSFLAHMGVFKPDRETTKCRVVFLSNLCERDFSRTALSHNQVMLSGPNLNQKITSALLHLRFDSLLLCFDIKKAFLNICLSHTDSINSCFYGIEMLKEKITL